MKCEVVSYPVRRGKVRDVFNLADGRLVIVTTDRHSAFDVNMTQGIPGKGIVLNRLCELWARVLPQVGNYCCITTDLAQMPKAFNVPELKGRTMMCHTASPLPIEGIVRGYLEGSGWAEYQQTGEVCGIKLPPGLQRCSKLSVPIFTPSTKAEEGHDVNITFERMCEMVGGKVSRAVRDWSVTLYKAAHDYAIGHGVIVADTKFEFGTQDGRLMLIDEILTPDSSRFWPAADYQPGRAQKSMDKQPLRDYLQKLYDENKWNKRAPPPALPDWLVQESQTLYYKIYRLLNNGNGLQ